MKKSVATATTTASVIATAMAETVLRPRVSAGKSGAPSAISKATETTAQSADLPPKILVLFGTRPEAIKLAPVVHELRAKDFRVKVVSSSQHKDLLRPFLRLLRVESDYDLSVMRENQTPNQVCWRVLAKLDKILDLERPDLILVQGDTTTTLAGALAGFNRRIPVGHVEAGLRSGNLYSPFPEEMNRRLTSQLTTLHFAATEKNRHNLLREGVSSEKIFVTGNTVVDSLQYILKNSEPSERIGELIGKTKGLKRILLTTHRRESFGATMSGNLKVLRRFVEKRKNVCLIFPVHPNPNVRAATEEILSGGERIYLLDPLDYADFIALMKKAWLIVSDSGGVQEEAPSLGKPLFILRENTERPEALEARIAKLVGGDPHRLELMLEENYAVETWIKSVKEIRNPFGDGRAARRIAGILQKELFARKTQKRQVNLNTTTAAAKF
jgi:UDP-N-acetylglucosamine 2-epimerase (non-hydrolysing)